MTDSDQRKQVVCYWWYMAEESLASARREFEAEAYIFAINRLYYALFYAVSATLLERKQHFKKHTGVRASFHRELIKTGLLEIRWAKLYDQLFEDRQEGDYIALMSFDRNYVENKLDQCIEFLNDLRPLLKSLNEV